MTYRYVVKGKFWCNLADLSAEKLVPQAPTYTDALNSANFKPNLSWHAWLIFKSAQYLYTVVGSVYNSFVTVPNKFWPKSEKAISTRGY